MLSCLLILTHRLLLPLGFTPRSGLVGEREAQGGGLASCLPLPQSLVLSFPTMKWPSQAA